jgi:hypothetical protein
VNIEGLRAHIELVSGAERIACRDGHSAILSRTCVLL